MIGHAGLVKCIGVKKLGGGGGVVLSINTRFGNRKCRHGIVLTSSRDVGLLVHM